ncbi:hypothetical protein [Sneathiella sp.]|uniref:hypothetical protein n=1 Tax=Sneathiella sp. TaxID=1964365 RepID=UPI00263239F4|nr:hypothetical protein [Sneathiella sp.]MDF2367930.1 hypothetical protein [Sneathiella sp.]
MPVWLIITVTFSGVADCLNFIIRHIAAIFDDTSREANLGIRLGVRGQAVPVYWNLIIGKFGNMPPEVYVGGKGGPFTGYRLQKARPYW